MYKLLSIRGIPLQNTCIGPMQGRMYCSIQLCSLCMKIPKSVSNLQIQRQTATMNSAEFDFPFRKRNKQKQKKYAELLEVIEGATKNKKAVIKKFDAAHLSIFVDQPDIGLDRLHKISNPSTNKNTDSKNTNTSNDSVNSYDSLNAKNHLFKKNRSSNPILFDDWSNGFFDGIRNDFKFKEFIENSSKINNVYDPENIELPEDTNKMYESLQEKSVYSEDKEESVIKDQIRRETPQDILVYLSVYLNCGMTQEALNLLTWYKGNKKSPLNTIYIKCCNLILEAYASRGKPNEVFRFYNKMKEDSVTPVPQTFVYILQSIGLSHFEERNELLQQVEFDMQKNNISLNDVFTKSEFHLTQREEILNLIKTWKPDFEPLYTSPDTRYDCQLLKNMINMQRDKTPVEGIISIQQMKDELQKQIFIECEGFTTIRSIKTDATDMKNSFSEKDDLNTKLVSLQKRWKYLATVAFEKNLIYLEHKEQQNGHRRLIKLCPFLKLLEKEQYVNCIVQEAQNLCNNSENYSTSLNVLYMQLGHRIYKKYEIQRDMSLGILDKKIDIYLRYIDWYLRSKHYNKSNVINSRTVWQQLAYAGNQYGASVYTDTMEWTPQICYNIGKFLYNIILNDLKFSNDYKNPSYSHGNPSKIPAFYTIIRNTGNKCTEQVKPHPILSKLHRDLQSTFLTFKAECLPSLIPPCPWTSPTSGGYIILKSNFSRYPAFAKSRMEMEDTSLQQLYPVFDSLNQLGSVPWKVNTRVLDIIIKVFQDGGSESLNVPQPPSILSPPPALGPNATKTEKLQAAKARRKLAVQKMNLYSLWCDGLYRLSIAHHLRNKIFWMPHNLDFRGRAYPIPPHLSHLGADLSRSLLVFAQGMPLGPKGLDWLKIHAINLTGLKKKAPISERLKYANENLDAIIESAENPLNGKMWWAKSEAPWQTLAACIEIASALKAPNVEEYVCNFPVHQDGSCNGLQHYAALGRDQFGAENVNLCQADAPKDIYSSVVALVEKQRKKDAEHGNNTAKALEGHIKRKVIKQTVMTTVYGVTRYGANIQIRRQLEDLKELPDTFHWPASLYLTEKTFCSIRTMFESARKIQDWFTDCAHIISSVYGKCITWTTPLGLTVTQPYFKSGKNNCLKPDTVKQKNAFAPNFIHSLDSSHMMLTSIYCEHAGITFVSVHDCFWTHAATVDIMNKICREQFVALHSQPILQDLLENFHRRYPLSQLQNISKKTNKNIQSNTTGKYRHFKEIPKQGSFDINEVLSSVYFFS